MTYHLITFGCQMNYSDSERIDSVFENMNIKSAEKNKADILIFNLCSVRQRAVDKVWGMLKNIKIQKHRKHPLASLGTGKSTENTKIKKLIIILTGCILPADKDKLKDKVDLILDIKNLASWPNIIRDYSFTNYKLRITNYEPFKSYFSITPKHSSPFTAYIPIMTGCDNFCSYCAVPYTRGKEYSRPAEEILKEVNKLCVQGYREIILLGQNVNSYQSFMSFPPPIVVEGRLQRESPGTSNCLFAGIPACAGMTKDDVVNFPILLKLIDSIPGNYWLSFLTSHPKDMSEELINCFKECKHLMPYLHLPLQSGSDKILKAMNRKYTAEQYVKLIHKIRKRFVNNSYIAISTDIIVGFPGETKKDFEATAALMKKIKFDMAYLAEYSPRPGTAAAKLKDNVSSAEKIKRKNYLNEILKKTALENNQKLVGQTVSILAESIKDNFAFGRTNMMKNVRIKLDTKSTESIKTQKILIGQFVKIKIIKAGPWGLEGEMVKK